MGKLPAVTEAPFVLTRSEPPHRLASPIINMLTNICRVLQSSSLFVCLFVFNIYLFIYLFIFGCVRSSLLHTGFLQLRRPGATLCCGAGASHCGGFSCCRARALGARASVVVAMWAQQLWLAGSRAQAWELWHMGLVAPWHVGSSGTRARTRVPCIGRRILNHGATREALEFKF